MNQTFELMILNSGRALTFFFLLVLGISAAMAYCYFTTLPQSYPLSYLVKKTSESKVEEKNLIDQISKAQILLIGDQHALQLKSYLESPDGPLLKTAEQLKTPLKLAVLSGENLGLHRINALLKKIPKLPSLIIYHGSSSEFYEKKINYSDFKKYQHNHHLFQNANIATLVLAFPQLGRFIYRPLDYVIMKEITAKNSQDFPPESQMDLIELNQILFRYELEALNQYIRSSSSNLIAVTTPTSLELAPGQVCPLATSDTTIEFQNEQQHQINEGRYKEAYQALLKLSEEVPGNAQTYYLMGKAAVQIGLFEEAREAYIKANAFDCAPVGNSVLINQTIRQWAQINSFQVIDFDQDLSRKIGHGEIFINNIYPQDYYYQQMLGPLTQAILRHFRI